MANESFHEIQLNGKQLVFVAMAGLVVAVVIFLCGVMVGRGVPMPRVAGGAGSLQGEFDPTARIRAEPPAASARVSHGLPPSAQETLTYADRLEARSPLRETLSEAAAGPREAPLAPPAQATPPDASGEPRGSGFMVHVAAFSERQHADTVARRLASKGYPSFVTVTDPGAPLSFRVRVGKYDERREAEWVASRIAEEEQFRPSITR